MSSADAGFILRLGRVSRDFGGTRAERVWQAEQILRSYGKWPPQQGEIFAIQIDQDSPRPPPPRPLWHLRYIGGSASKEELAWRRGFEAVTKFTQHYTGKTCLFRVNLVGGLLRLQELNPAGPFSSASHAGQIDPAGTASCNGKVCGIPWLRNGIYTYKAGPFSLLFNPLEDARMSVARESRNPKPMLCGENSGKSEALARDL